MLNRGIENGDSQVFRLEKGWTLHFLIGHTLVGYKVRLFVDHPDTVDVNEKTCWRELSWTIPSDGHLDVCDGHAEVEMVKAGSFRYYFTMEGHDDIERADGFGFFLVDPELTIGKSRSRLPLDGIRCQTVLSKLLGPFSEWEGRLVVAKYSGYNVVHFTPLQALGASNSAYALNDLSTLNPVFSTDDRKIDFGDIQQLVKHLNDEHGLLSFTDLVFNHISTESHWLSDHPECIYNLNNSPHLKPAYILDRCLIRFSEEVAHGVWELAGIPSTLSEEVHLESMAKVLHDCVLPELRLEEFFQVSVDRTVTRFRSLIGRDDRENEKEELKSGTLSDLRIIPDPSFRRLRGSVDMRLALQLFYDTLHSECSVEERIQQACKSLKAELERLNAVAKAAMMRHLSAVVRNFVANARYRFVDSNGLKLGKVTTEQKIMNRYFVNPFGLLEKNQEEDLIHDTEKNKFCMAHNGWVDNIGNPLPGFGGPDSNVYLRRELNSWEDSVKLWYGKRYEDSPFLWEEMRMYVRRTAETFDGVRVDNCHNTSVHVAEWMLAEARSVKPDLYIMGELFTPGAHFDGIYVNHLGLNSLICESFVAGSPRDLSGWLRKNNARPVGSFFQIPFRPLSTSLAHDILYDQTHDNPSIVEKRSAYDVLPNAALVAMAACAIGSSRGYDEVVPRQISVVTEQRYYRSWSDDEAYDRAYFVGVETGIIRARRILNNLHQMLITEGFREFSAEHITESVIVTTRQNPFTRESVILVAHTAFFSAGDTDTVCDIPPYPFKGTVSRILLEAHINIDSAHYSAVDEPMICGLETVRLVLQEDIDVRDSDVIKLSSIGSEQVVEFVKFPPSSIVVFRLSLEDSVRSSLIHLHQLLTGFGHQLQLPDNNGSQTPGEAKVSELEEILNGLSFCDLNCVLFRCDLEERGEGGGVYHVPGFGDLLFCGLAGVNSVLTNIRTSNDVDHPLCCNLRSGDWLMDYQSSRLLARRGTRKLGAWLEEQFGHAKKLPRALVPCYVDALMVSICAALEELAWSRMSNFIRGGSTFARALALASLQVCGASKGGILPPLSPSLDLPSSLIVDDGDTSDAVATATTIAAGLPHFSTGAFRCWGRDTFVSIRGLMLITGRYEEARCLILAFAGYLRYGLIPNFLGTSSQGPRYNSRDAVWWWLQAVQDYCRFAPNGLNILTDKVLRSYNLDDTCAADNDRHEQMLHDVMQESLERHAAGVKYLDSTGVEIDHDMTSEGFEVTVGIDWDSGFVYGGNEHNCGTWMDKMGSSSGAGNLGKAATPRDGSSVELVGLCYSTVRWLAELSRQQKYPHDGVSFAMGDVEKTVTFEYWRDLIAGNFEPSFWIGDDPQIDVHPELVNRRRVYRDVYRCSRVWSEYQLRPNFCIAIAVASDMFDPLRAWDALQLTKTVLMGPLGIKTLDPSDWEYVGYYDNSENSNDFKTAHGFSYHQGPEWVWPVGFFLRALIQVAWKLNETQSGILRDTVVDVKRILATHHAFIHASDWKSLPELTNEDGQFCEWSCQSQAWSIGCILDAHFDCELASRFLRESSEDNH